MSPDVTGRKIYFEDCQVGDCHTTVSMTVEKQALIDFAMQWDPQPWHVDEELASQSMFAGLTACTAHIFSIFSILSQQWENGEKQQALASLGFDEMRMLKPVYAGDTLYCRNIIELARPSASKSDRGIVAARCELINQKDEVVFRILSTYLMAKKSINK
jgi:acyl dehydratase